MIVKKIRLNVFKNKAMKIICLDGKEFLIKYMQNKESITTDFGTSAFDYPLFNGSKIYHGSTSSDKYSMTFAIHRTLLVGLKESLKKIYDQDNVIVHEVYGKLEHIIIEHESFGAIKGNIIGSVSYDTSSDADIICKCIFQEHTEDNPIIKKDLQDENLKAFNDIDTETSDNFDVTLSTKDKSALSKFAVKLQGLYTNIQNSAVVSAFNDFNRALNETTLDSLRIMNAVKNILYLPMQVKPNIKSKLALLTEQANAIKAIPITSYNIALFNANVMAYNTGITSKTAFVSESALTVAAGIKAVNMT